MATRKKAESLTEEVTLQEPETATKKEQPVLTSGYVHIDVFLNTARVLFQLSQYQVAGFRAYMQGKAYQKTDADFIPYLEKYLGKEVK